MQGASTIQEQKEVLEKIIADQRELIAKHINNKVDRVPQLFIPYKEVLDIYHAGLQLPDDVTLMWCDDNYAYIRYLPNDHEQARQGGNALYYHLSYWGRPHDYLWLATTSPALIRTELKRAYDHNTRKMWIFNNGDIKPAEYLLEYALDLAWDEQLLTQPDYQPHLQQWLTREFGNETALTILPAFTKFYNLSYRCKPEFLGNTRTEERDPLFKTVKDLPWSDADITTRLQQCRHIMEQTMATMPDSIELRYPQWFQLIGYPLLSFCQMNNKMLGAQWARHGAAPWSESIQAYNEIQNLTAQYNALLNGKWQHMMDAAPRNLPVFAAPDTTQQSSPITNEDPILVVKPSQGSFGPNSYIVPLLGYSQEALALAQKESFTTTLPALSDSILLILSFVPNHPIDNNGLQVELAFDNETPQTYSYHTKGRSEAWKNNVLYNQASIEIVIPPATQTRTLSLTASTPAVILDEITIKPRK